MIVQKPVFSGERHRLGRWAPAEQAPSAPALSLSIVAQWLAVQNHDVRRECAALLASDLEAAAAVARESGFKAGQAAGEAEAKAKHEHLLGVLREMLARAETANAQALAELSADCAAIVAAAFSKLAAVALVTPDATLAAVRGVLARAIEGQHYVIYLHPRDLPTVHAELPALTAAFGTRPLELAEDGSLQFGGCRLESEFGGVDAAFDVQLRSLLSVLSDAHAARTAAP
jgi:flagellar assembly protein FliH